jgi:hypothetical protein
LIVYLNSTRSIATTAERGFFAQEYYRSITNTAERGGFYSLWRSFHLVSAALQILRSVDFLLKNITAALQILRSKTLAGGKQKRRSNDRLSYMKS